MHAIAVRAICFMEETGLSVSQTIDGNDYQATHFVIYAKREPIGATRLRWFRDLAKIERTGFRPAYRNIRILKRTGDVIFRHPLRRELFHVIRYLAEACAAGVTQGVTSVLEPSRGSR
jgi:hypothetical protein